MTDLLDAIDQLTKPYTITVRDIHGNPTTDDTGREVKVQQPARLEQLHDAIASSGNTGGPNGASRAERSLLNAGALEQWTAYRDRINKAARDVNVTIHHDPSVTLRRWYVEVNARTLTDAFTLEWAGRFTAWARDIDRRLNPPYQREVTSPCPFCGERKAIDKVNNEIVTAVIAECWRDTDGADTSWFIRCRFCGANGVTLTQVREWAYGIEQAEEVTA